MLFDFSIISKMAKTQESQVEQIRIINTDIKGTYSLLYGFTQIKGVNVMLSNALCNVLKFDKTRKIYTLTDEEVEKIESFLSNPKKVGIPTWLLNNRKELETGEDLHYVSKDIDFLLLQNTRRFAKLKTYKSQRRKAGVTLRGQRTKSNFRKNKMYAAMKSKKLNGNK
ncbi:MAG: 30S ribosomal protein S13 [Nanoarchaeota archaeon]